MKSALPFSASPAEGGSACCAPTVNAISTTMMASAPFRVQAMLITSPRFGHGVDQRRLAALDRGKRARDGRSELGRIGDRPFAMNAEPLGHFRVVDRRVHELAANAAAIDPAAVPVAHFLDVHQLLMICAVVVH